MLLVYLGPVEMPARQDRPVPLIPHEHTGLQLQVRLHLAPGARRRVRLRKKNLGDHILVAVTPTITGAPQRVGSRTSPCLLIYSLLLFPFFF